MDVSNSVSLRGWPYRSYPTRFSLACVHEGMRGVSIFIIASYDSFEAPTEMIRP